MSKEFQIRDGNLIASFDLENEDGDIDFCKLLKVSHGVADEIGMFVDYVATNKIIKDQSKQIADLEAKLADYNEIMNDYNIQNIAELDEFLAKYDFDEDEDGNIISQVIVSDQKYIDIGYFNTIYKENEQLKQQLAEKEKEFEWLHKKFAKYVENNQDKITFAVEQLRLLKSQIIEKRRLYKGKFSEFSNGVNDSLFDVEEDIDNQIKQLKERSSMSKVLELLDAMNKGKITNHDVLDILTKSDEKSVNHINDILTEKDQRIAELEEQLKNAIVPKFKIGQDCYVLLGKDIERIKINSIRIKVSKEEDENFTMYSITDAKGYGCSIMEEQLFATKEEAEAKLKELKG